MVYWSSSLNCWYNLVSLTFSVNCWYYWVYRSSFLNCWYNLVSWTSSLNCWYNLVCCLTLSHTRAADQTDYSSHFLATIIFIFIRLSCSPYHTGGFFENRISILILIILILIIILIFLFHYDF